MYGLTIFTGGHGPERFRRVADIAAEAERAGFDAVWTGELYSRSSTVPMTAIAAATDRIRIGSNIAYGVGRSPLMWSAEARDLDEISGGRIILGLGNGTPKMMEQWHGVDGSRPAGRMEELVGLLRKLWRLHAGPVHHDGEFYSLHVTPTAEVGEPYSDRLPIWIAGVNPRMVRAAGAVGDGLVGHPMFTARYVEEVARPQLAAGAERTNRDPSEIALKGMLMCAVDADVERARRSLAYAIAQYAASRVYDRLFAMHGWSEAQQRIRDAARAGDDDAAIEAVPADAVDEIGVACAPGELAEQVARHAAPYDHLNVVIPPWGLAPDETERGTRALIDEMGPALSRLARV